MTHINMIGTTIGKIKVMSFAGRTKKAEPLYNMSCQHCGVQFRECHHNIMNALEGYLGQVQCPNGSCRLGLVEKKEVIKELEPLYIGVDEASTVTTEHPRFTSATLVPSKRPKELSEYDRVCKARAFYEHDKLSYEHFTFIKDYRPKLFNKVWMDVELFEGEQHGQ
jgi:hypothetical protein